MPVTSIYGWPYQHRLEAPGLNPEAIEALAKAIEKTMATVDAPPTYCRLYRSAALSIVNITPTAITWDAEDSDTFAMHDLVTNPSFIVVPVAGIYHVEAKASYAGNATGERFLWISNNGVAILGSGVFTTPGTTNACRLHTQTTQRFSAGDAIKIETFQSSGGNLNINAHDSFNPQYTTTVTVTRRGGNT